jgi:hypothetical protein
MSPTVMTIDADTRMEWDGRQVILSRRVTRTPKGKEKGGPDDFEDWEPTGYYSGFVAAARALFHQGIGQFGDISAAQFIAKAETLSNRVGNLVADAIKEAYRG